MDRTDAIRLLKALVAAGMNTRAPRANAWIEKKALEIGLQRSQFVSAIAYAGNEGWLIDARQRGWSSLTNMARLSPDVSEVPVDPPCGMVAVLLVATGPGTTVGGGS